MLIYALVLVAGIVIGVSYIALMQYFKSRRLPKYVCDACQMTVVASSQKFIEEYMIIHETEESHIQKAARL